MSAQRRWSIWKKLLMYPMILGLAVEVLCVWLVIDETISPPRMIDGHADDGSRNAGLMLGILVPVLYIGYASVIGIVRLGISALTNGFDSDR